MVDGPSFTRHARGSEPSSSSSSRARSKRDASPPDTTNGRSSSPLGFPAGGRKSWQGKKASSEFELQREAFAIAREERERLMKDGVHPDTVLMAFGVRGAWGWDTVEQVIYRAWMRLKRGSKR